MATVTKTFKIGLSDAEISGFVKTTGNQTVGGQKQFSDDTTFDADVFVHGETTVGGDIVPSTGEDGLKIGSSAIPFDKIYVNAINFDSGNLILAEDSGDLYIDNGNEQYTLATQDWVENQGYVDSTAISDMATKTWVSNQGYITGIDSSMITTALGYTPLSSNDISDMATKTWVSQQGYITSYSDTWRPIYVDGTQILNSSFAGNYLNVKAGTNVSLSVSQNPDNVRITDLTINCTASGGTDLYVHNITYSAQSSAQRSFWLTVLCSKSTAMTKDEFLSTYYPMVINGKAKSYDQTKIHVISGGRYILRFDSGSLATSFASGTPDYQNEMARDSGMDGVWSDTVIGKLN